jgi:mono/diheme cytochrome c family protein
MKKICAVVAVFGWFCGMHNVAAFESLLERGMYVSYAAGCATCHTRGDFLAGGRSIHTPAGTFYTPNITPDPQHGIGSWTEENFARALREGIGSTGEHLYPACPYPSFSKMTEQDRSGLWVYLLSQRAVPQEDREHALPWFLSSRELLSTWKRGWFEPGRYVRDPTKSKQWNRGAYLVDVLGHCGECHTPRSTLGRSQKDYYLAGAHRGPERLAIPNITPDRQTGIGRWSEDELKRFLYSGERPDGSFAPGLMQEVLHTSVTHLTEDDRQAIVVYLRSVPPIRHDIGIVADPFEAHDHFP